MTTSEIQELAQCIADSIPVYRRPGLLTLKATHSKSAIRRWSREFVRQNTRDLLNPVVEGRVAAVLVNLLGLKKRRRYRRNAKLGDK
jgi:hypothetical protein